MIDHLCLFLWGYEPTNITAGTTSSNASPRSTDRPNPGLLVLCYPNVCRLQQPPRKLTSLPYASPQTILLTKKIYIELYRYMRVAKEIPFNNKQNVLAIS